MFEFFRRDKQDSQFPDTALASSRSTVAFPDVRPELVRVAFKDTMSVYGIPAEWLDCQVVRLCNKNGVDRIQVQLIIQTWNGYILRYGMAIERQILACLDRYEPGVDHSAYEWVWRYAPDCDCPFPNMPEPEQWEQKKAAYDNRTASNADKPYPVQAAEAGAKDGQNFDLRDAFSDLKPQDLRMN